MATKIQTKDLDLKPIKSTWTWSQYELSIERFTSYEDWATIFRTPHVINESWCTINVNWLWEIQLVWKDWVVLWAWDLQPWIWYFITYNASTWEFTALNLWEWWWTWSTQEINMVFDDDGSDLPVDTSQTIDWCTVNDWDVIYVKACSDNTKEWKFYEAEVNWTNIWWIERYDLKVYNPTYVTCWTVYWWKVNYFSDYLFSWNVTFMWDEVNFSSNTTVNYDWNTINYNNVTENYTDSTTNVDWWNVTYNNTEITYDSNYTLLWCTSWITSFPADVNLETDVTKAHITVNYDNTANDPNDIWTKEIDIVEWVWTVIINKSWKTWNLSVKRDNWDTVIHIEKIDWDWNFTVDVCQYSWWVIISDNWSIQNVENAVVNNTSVNEYYDENSTVINEWDTYLKNVYVENIYNQDWTTLDWWYKLDYVELADSWDTVSLNKTPVSNVYIKVYKKDSWLVRFETTDYTYDATNNQVILNTPLTTWEVVRVEYWYKWSETTTPQDNYNTVEVVNSWYTANPWEFILVTYNSWDVTLTLPDANNCEWQVIRVKKFTWNDTYNVIIDPQSWQTIDWDTWVTFNIDKNQFAFIAVWGNRYIF